ncbi:uncharacterized protein [Venturia canescens]|uniref:uncharacterized protein n=1 Tax=Venturia canescens TaxID=32260 RepID=UPI001C9BDECC|nr:uncharacterized protein LOC122411518 [Venturia canescens]XP_043276309.1 uncharacterized protein LOC122411518 [Venturia canescens]
MPQSQMNGDPETEIEIKVEPSLQNYVEENDMDFPGYDKSPSTQANINMESSSWTSHATTCLINQYKRFHSMVGQTARLRSRREMYEIISLEMQKHGYAFSPQKCENKWKVLERKYKNLIFRERLKKPGRIKHYGHWEHRRALDEIFHETRSQFYLDEKDSPVPSSAIRLVQQPVTETDLKTKENEVDTALTSNPAETPKSRDPFAIFQTLLIAMNKNIAIAEANSERRHRERMVLKQAKLEIQRKMLELKEQKVACKKSKKLIK